MSEGEKFGRSGSGTEVGSGSGIDLGTEPEAGDAYRHSSGREVSSTNGLPKSDSEHHDFTPVRNAREPLSRVAGSPLPIGGSGRPLQAAQGERTYSAGPGRAISVPAHHESEVSSGMQWAMGVFKQAVPFFQKLLPLLDGQVATAVANLLAPRPHPPAPMVDLQPIERNLSELQVQQRDLREQLVDQNASIKKVEDQLEMVREATDRNTLEQQELIEDLKSIGSRVNLLAISFLVLLAISILLNIALFLHIQRVLP